MLNIAPTTPDYRAKAIKKLLVQVPPLFGIFQISSVATIFIVEFVGEQIPSNAK